MSTDSANPSAKFGGTWVAWGSGRVPVGVDTSDTAFDTVEETGGSKSQSYTPAGSNAAVKLTADQSGVPAHSHGLNSHKHSVGAHSHGLNSHTHGVGTLSVTGGSHNHYAANGKDTFFTGASKTSFGYGYGSSAMSGYYPYIGNLDTMSTSSTSHSHTISGSTGAASGSTANSTAFDTGAATGSTANNTAAAASESHNHTFTGTAATISHLQPYITCYMWKRTA